ncbi:MAG: MFS transporter [Chloroflexi bacterium]|nr:MFS transporter [Chloroflexota bacterium]
MSAPAADTQSGSRWSRGAFAPLASGAYRRLWTATLIQFLGMMTAGVVRAFLAYDLTGSNTAVAAQLFAFGLALFPSMFWAGVIIDRFSRKTVLSGAQVLLMVQALLLGLLTLSGVLEYWMLFSQSLIEGVSVAFLVPSRQAMTGQLLGGEGAGRGVVLQQGAMGFGRILGPIGGGWLVGTLLGAGGVFLLVALCYGVAAWMTFRVPGEFRSEEESQGSFLENLAAGLRYVRGRPALRVTVITAYVVALTSIPYFVLLPGMVIDVFGRDSFELGAITSASSVGAIAVTIWAAAVVHRPSAWGLFLGTSFVFGLVVVAFGLAPTFPIALVIIVLLGAVEMGYIAFVLGLGMAYSHRRYDGRVQALIVSSFSFLGFVSIPIGLVADAIGVRGALIIEGLAGSLLVAVVVLYSRRIGAAEDARIPADEERIRALAPEPGAAGEE